MLSKEITTLLIFAGIAFLLLVLVSQKSDYLVRGRIEVREPFEDKAETPVTGVSEPSPALAPAPADIDNKRQPYHLLRGVIADATTDAPSDLSYEKSYERNPKKVLEKTESYAQRTNNFKHKTPDSYTAPFPELSNSFYAV
jgi:hypothetical protein